MLSGLIKQLSTAVILLLFFTVLTGMLYPAFITLAAQTFFPLAANGSLIMRDNIVIGSSLIGQSFNANKYFWGRPSATDSYPYNALASGGSNYGPLNPDFIAAVKSRKQQYELSMPQNHASIPVELVTASASGLDPDISPLAAFYQISRIAKARNLPEDTIEKLIRLSLKRSCFGIMGEPRVNVLQLNLQLDEQDQHSVKDRKL